MLQRIQTVYLVAAALLIIAGLTLNYYEAKIVQNNQIIEQVTLSATELTYLHEESDIRESETPTFLLATAVLAFLFTGGIIFLYKNRMLQVKLIRLSILLVAAKLMLVFFYYVDHAEQFLTAEPTNTGYEWSVYMGILAMILLFLAQKAVLKDEQVVRSAERIR
jgi:hypothetical protein